MGRKLPFLPTCGSPDKTLSFRASTTTAAAAAAGAAEFEHMAATGETDSSIESVIRGLSSDRFFFKPGKTSSILEEAKPNENEKETTVLPLPFKESVSMMEMESTDPFVDFKKSMQEMVEADEGLKEWENLQELLSLYLTVNDKINHGYIIRAFVDLMLVNLGTSSTSPSSCSCSSSSSMNVQDQSLLMEESGSSRNKKMIISSESPESVLSLITSSSASSSGTCSSTSHCLSSCSLEEEEEEEEEDDDDDDDDDDNSAQKAVVSDNASSSCSSSSLIV